MRNAFLRQLLAEAKTNPHVFLVVGDLGYSVIEPFRDQFPERFINAGIAEQHMAGMAAGLGFTGFNVFIYSIANFPTLRCLEQIRNDIVYHQANVKVVAVGAGLAYGSLGYSHHAVQDIACLRSLPGMLMATPGDPVETTAVTTYLSAYDGPAYLRLGKGGEPMIHKDHVKISAQGPLLVQRGSNNKAILACGTALPIAMEAGLKTGSSVYSCPLWAASNETVDALCNVVGKHERLVVAEEHLAAGGFGSFVRESLETIPELQQRIRCVALHHSVCSKVGKAEDLRIAGGLTSEVVVEQLTSK